MTREPIIDGHMTECPRPLETAEATVAAGRELALALIASGLDQMIIYLEGELGAGKTTFARGFLRALGHTDRVPSPTYTLIEPYALDPFRVYHIDLYRLAGPAEAGELGLEELPGPGVVMLVEWPERAGARLARPDLTVGLDLAAPGRSLVLSAASVSGRCLLAHKIASRDL
jgi:tRNA threonylcarbamoyladenosine biosynthesis protein TsaE